MWVIPLSAAAIGVQVNACFVSSKTPIDEQFHRVTLSARNRRSSSSDEASRDVSHTSSSVRPPPDTLVDLRDDCQLIAWHTVKHAGRRPLQNHSSVFSSAGWAFHISCLSVCLDVNQVSTSDVNKDWTHEDKDKDQTYKDNDKDLTYNDLQGLTDNLYI